VNSFSAINFTLAYPRINTILPDEGLTEKYWVTAIQRLTILADRVAVRTLQMVEGRDNSDLPASVAFSVDQQQCLSQLADTLEGYTKKQKNPYPRACLPWAVWLIARLGGWSGYIAILNHFQ